MATAPDFHILVSAKAREGTYQVRLYSVPFTQPMTMADVNSSNTHWGYIGKTKAVTLDTSVLTAIGPQQIDAESELEQGNPRYASLQVDLLADPALQVVVENMRDQTKNIWCEITLFQNLLDEPTRGTSASLVWPRKEKLFFWGFLDRKSTKGKVNDQRFGANNLVRRDAQKFTDAHDGTISFVFFDWRTWSNFQQVKRLLDTWTGAPTYADGLGNDEMSAQVMMTALIAALAPTSFFMVCDQQMNPPVTYTRQGFTSLSVQGDPTSWGKLSVTIKAPDGTPTVQLRDVFFPALVGGFTGGLLLYTATAQKHTQTSDQDSTTLYHWNNLAQALTEWCREFFFDWQCELPTLEQAANPGKDFAASCARFLLLDISTTPTTGKPLTVYLDPLEQTIEYDPCGAWASSYTIDVPDEGTILPAVASVFNSAFPGGSDESYTTLLRIEGWDNGSPTALSPSPYDIFVPDATGTPKAATVVEDNNSGFRFTSTQTVSPWGLVHAYKKISQWGSPRAIVTVTSRGVGLEPFGASATENSKAIAPPVKTYGLYDFSDFPLGRQCLGLPGIMATPGDSSTSEQELGLSVISIKRTPNGDTELKMVEVYSDNLGVPLSLEAAAPPAPPPPPPPPPRGTITP